MKKILLFFVLSIFILSGCGKQNNISNPYEIKAGSKILSMMIKQSLKKMASKHLIVESVYLMIMI